jgi:hypothetical protein
MRPLLLIRSFPPHTRLVPLPSPIKLLRSPCGIPLRTRGRRARSAGSGPRGVWRIRRRTCRTRVHRRRTARPSLANRGSCMSHRSSKFPRSRGKSERTQPSPDARCTIRHNARTPARRPRTRLCRFGHSRQSSRLLPSVLPLRSQENSCRKLRRKLQRLFAQDVLVREHGCAKKMPISTIIVSPGATGRSRSHSLRSTRMRLRYGICVLSDFESTSAPAEFRACALSRSRMPARRSDLRGAERCWGQFC